MPENQNTEVTEILNHMPQLGEAFGAMVDLVIAQREKLEKAGFSPTAAETAATGMLMAMLGFGNQNGGDS